MKENLFRKMKFFAWMIFAVIFLCGIIFLILFFRGPAVGTVSKKEADISREEIPVEQKVKEFRGTNFSLLLPESFEEKRDETPDRNSGSILEQAFFSEGDVGGRKLAVVIERRPSGGITELSAVAFRMLHPETYTHETISIEDRRVSLFTKDEVVYEVTGFFEKGSFTASVSVTSAVARPEKIKDFFFETVKGFEFSGTVTSSD